LVITLGANNWVVTWIGHGQITESNIIEKIWAKSVPYIIIMSKYRSWHIMFYLRMHQQNLTNKFI
jgi:hypothetical protein